MAGSYFHCRSDRTGAFWFDLIENMRDAYQACHEMFYMIDYLAGGNQTLIKAAAEEYYRRCRGEAPWDDRPELGNPSPEPENMPPVELLKLALKKLQAEEEQ